MYAWGDHRRFNSYSGYFRRTFGGRVQKISVDAGFTCPNRDGKIGEGGCTFCNNGAFTPSYCIPAKSIGRQIAEGIEFHGRRYRAASRYLVYFQSFSNTYAPLERLRALYGEALAYPGVAGIVIGTRPDCVPDAVLDLLCEYKDLGYEVWLELGLQTAHDKTLHRINRGHDFACYQNTTRLARERGLKVCSHLIVGLPGEGQAECLQTMERVVETGVDGIKLHPLHIVKGSTMAKAWEAGRLNGIELDDYAVTAGEMIRHTPPEVIYHRISASARRPTLLAPLWCENRWTGMVELDKYLNEHGVQGSALGTPWVQPVI